jgi:hypothetical protein
VSRRLGAVACLVLIPLSSGCGGGGGGERTIGADALRDCLARHGASFGGERPGATGYAPLFHLAPDLQGRIAGSSIAVFLEKSAGAARRDAADARGALGAVGIAGGNGTVIQRANAVVVFEPAPSPGAREAVTSCLAAA